MRRGRGRDPDITAVLTAHREGAMAGISLHSMEEAIGHAEASGLTVERIAVLDRPSAPTRAVFHGLEHSGWILCETDYGDQGRVRNEAATLAAGEYVAFLDGDDLWGYNWLTEAYGLCLEAPGSIIAHPEYNVFFQGNNNLFIHTDQTDPSFRREFLRFANYWDALCLAPVGAYLDHPFPPRDIEGGFAFEDWHWNCETLEAGFIHRVAPDTIIFKRRRLWSQTLEASRRKALVRPTSLFRWADYGED